MIGKTISHYKIIEKLGEGGMGVVYKAEDTKLKRRVALKFLSPLALGSEEEKTRFVHEAQAAATLDHPNICTVYEIDQAEGQTFIAMAYIDGKSLREMVHTPLPIEDAANYAIQVAQGLKEAHEKGVVHRDVKSANLMVTPKHSKVQFPKSQPNSKDRSGIPWNRLSKSTESWRTVRKRQRAHTALGRDRTLA